MATETTIYDEPWSPSDINCNWKPEKLSRYSFVINNSNYYNPVEKDMTPLDIVDNKEGVQIYQDLHFEVYVKAEATIKNFVDCFNLKVFQQQADFKFQAFTPSYYAGLASPWKPNISYKVGDIVKRNVAGLTYYYCCKRVHGIIDPQENFDPLYWYQITDSATFLNIVQNVKEENYSLDNPWVAHLVFKNLWGCDITNYLKIFTRSSNFCLTYSRAFAENLLKNDLFGYNKFFDKGYFKNNDDTLGARFLLGESWKEDSLLGNNKLNNYTNLSNIEDPFEQKHNIGSDWNYLEDSVIQDYFNNDISNPFDHFYKFVPNIGMPFFKEKVFKDCLIQIALQRKDVLGNIFQRFVQLPILVTFTNNLIKIYTKNTDSNRIYNYEYLASDYENKFIASALNTQTTCRFTIWCPNIERLSISSTVLGPLNIVKEPELVIKNGQLGVMEWIFDAGAVGTKMLATHVLEYNDGENYDKFIYIESITLN